MLPGYSVISWHLNSIPKPLLHRTFIATAPAAPTDLIMSSPPGLQLATTSNSRYTIHDMPAELFDEILALISVADISSLSRTCRTLHSYLSPRVYHTQDWYWKDDHPSPPYHLLLRTLLSNPRLTGYVKVVKLRGGGIVREEGWNRGYWLDTPSGLEPLKRARSIWKIGQCPETFFTPGEIQAIHDLVSYTTVCEAYKRDAVQEFNRGNVDVMVALILQHTQAIEHLDLGFGYLQHAEFVPRTFQYLMNCTTAIAPYPHLTSATLGSDGMQTLEDVWLGLDLFRLFLYLPKLVQMETMFLEPVIFAWPSPTKTPQAMILSTLELRNTTASEDTLGMILSCTPNLKHLVYDHHRMVALGMSHWKSYQQLLWSGAARPQVLLHGPRLSKALAHVKDTLQSLVLKVRFEGEVQIDIKDLRNTNYLCGLIGRVSGLERMPKLTSLEISWVLLLGWQADYDGQPGILKKGPDIPEADIIGFSWPNILPPTMQLLRIRDDLSDFSHYPHQSIDQISLVKSLLISRETYFEALARVDFVSVRNFFYDHGLLPTILGEKLPELCHARGIASVAVRERCP